MPKGIPSKLVLQMGDLKGGKAHSSPCLKAGVSCAGYDEKSLEGDFEKCLKKKRLVQNRRKSFFLSSPSSEAWIHFTEKEREEINQLVRDMIDFIERRGQDESGV